MSQQQNAQLSNREGRIQLALSAYNTHQFRSLRRAAEAFDVPPSTLTSRYNGITYRLDTRNAQHKLTATEEQTIVQYILFFDVFTEENCRKAFEMVGLVPINAEVVLDRLEVRLRTPPAPPPQETPWQSKTPSNTQEFGSQSKLVRESFTRSPVTAQTGFSQLVKGAELMLHQNALLIARNHELEEQLAVMTKRKSRKRKWIQQGGTIEYGTVAAQVAAEASVAPQGSKKARGSGDQETARPTVRRCGNCGGTGHNARTCKKDTEISSELDTSTTYVGSLFDSDEIEDA